MAEEKFERNFGKNRESLNEKSNDKKETPYANTQDKEELNGSQQTIKDDAINLNSN